MHHFVHRHASPRQGFYRNIKMEGGRGRRNNSTSALAWATTSGASLRPPPAPKKGDSVRQKSFHTHAIQKTRPHSKDKQISFAATHHQSQAGGTLRTKNLTCLLNGGRLSESHDQRSSLRMLLLGWSRGTIKANPIGSLKRARAQHSYGAGFLRKA